MGPLLIPAAATGLVVGPTAIATAAKNYKKDYTNVHGVNIGEIVNDGELPATNNQYLNNQIDRFNALKQSAEVLPSSPATVNAIENTPVDPNRVAMEYAYPNIAITDLAHNKNPLAHLAGVNPPKPTETLQDTILNETSKEVLGKTYKDIGNGLVQPSSPEPTVGTPTSDINFREANVSPSSVNIDNVVKDIIKGNYGTGKNRIDKLTALGLDPKLVQAKVNEQFKGAKTSKTSVSTPSKKESSKGSSKSFLDSLQAWLPMLALASSAYYVGKKL